MAQDNADYFAAREKAERRAAREATSRAARMAHLKLAESYADKIKAVRGPGLVMRD